MKAIHFLCCLFAVALFSCSNGEEDKDLNMDTANTLNDTFPAPKRDTIPKDGTYVDSMNMVH